MGIFGPPNIEQMKAWGDIVGLIKALGYRKDHNVRKAAAEALYEFGTPAVEPLITALKDENRDVRCAAACSLGKNSDPQAWDPFVAALKDEDREVRMAVAELMGKIGDPRAMKPLIDALNDEDCKVGQVAAWALGKFGSEAVEPLIAALKGKHWIVRKAIVEALGKARDSRVTEPLLTALGDGRWNVRIEAAEALGKVGDSRAVEPLIDALKDNNVAVRERAAQALRCFDTNQARDALKGYQDSLKARQAEPQLNEKIQKPDYIVGRHLANAGIYRWGIGTETIGYFDPLKVVFRAFDERGRQLTIAKEPAFALDWPPPCESKQEQEIFTSNAERLALALKTHGKKGIKDHTLLLRMMMNPLGDPHTLVTGLRKVGRGEVDRFILESTVLPFFKRYSRGEVMIIDEVATEVSLNALFNFLCSKVMAGFAGEYRAAVSLNDIRTHAIEAIRRIEERK